jgi:hypothetical protein
MSLVLGASLNALPLMNLYYEQVDFDAKGDTRPCGGENLQSRRHFGLDSETEHSL